MRVKQHPEYLKNQSRQGHARCRRSQAWSNAMTIIWLIITLSLFGAALIDWVARLQWGLAEAKWVFFGGAIFGVVCWCVNRAINKIILAYIRHTYGPDPSEAGSPH